MAGQRGRPKKVNPQVEQRNNGGLRKFIGKNQRTDFSFLKEVLPKKFRDKVFRLVTDDETHSNISEKIYLGWEPVKITPEDAEASPLLQRFMFDKEEGEGATIRIPVNPNNPQMGVWGILMMKSKAAFEKEERAALNAEVARTEVGLKGGADQAETGVDQSVLYAPNVDAHGTRGYKETHKDTLI